MSSSRNHQGAHGIGQAEDQLNNQAEAAAEIQGESELDRNIAEAAKQPYKSSEEDAE